MLRFLIADMSGECDEDRVACFLDIVGDLKHRSLTFHQGRAEGGKEFLGV